MKHPIAYLAGFIGGLLCRLRRSFDDDHLPRITIEIRNLYVRGDYVDTQMVEQQYNKVSRTNKSIS